MQKKRKRAIAMKKVIMIMAGIFAMSGCLWAQNEDKTGMEWVLEEGMERVQIDPGYQGISVYQNGYDWMPFTPMMGYTVYGSQYRKARAKKEWGTTLTLCIAPLAIAYLGWAIDDGTGFAIGLGVAGTAACLGAGIPLWVKGQRELDWMMDDYARRYGPRPYSSSLSVGPTGNGVGLAFNF